MEDNKKYDLYTEHIVPEKGKKIRSFLKKSAVVVGAAAVFGLVAGLVMIIVYDTGNKIIDPNDKQEQLTIYNGTTEADTEYTGENLTLETGSVTQEPQTTEESMETVNADNEAVADIYSSLKGVVNKVNYSSVKIETSKNSVDWLNSTYQNVNESYGIIVAAGSDRYYILTSYAAVLGAESITVTYNDGTISNAEYISGDVTTGFAVITAGLVNSSVVAPASVSASPVSLGDVTIGVGRLYGFVNSMGYGVVTGSGNRVSDTDSVYGLINTDIVGSEDSTGVLVNLNGEITGLITTSYNSGSSWFITAYPINDIMSRIEKLINGGIVPYFGIKGQGVTNAINTDYSIPYGIYIASVEISSPAFVAGIQNADVITAIDGQAVRTMADFMEILSSHLNGDTIEVTVQRSGRNSYNEIVFSVTLGVE